jgi:hypothetical protein
LPPSLTDRFPGGTLVARSRVEDKSLGKYLPSHVAPVFEGLARSWVRRTYGSDLTRVGAWWGLAQHALRRTGARTSEEIDLIGLSSRTIKVVGECRWRRAPMDVAVLAELRNFKMPALAQVNGVRGCPTYRGTSARSSHPQSSRKTSQTQALCPAHGLEKRRNFPRQPTQW